MTGFIDPLEANGSEPELDAAADLASVRDLVLKAHPDVVPELVRGASITELLASIEPAHLAYEHLATRIQDGLPPTVALPVVPAGGTGPVPLDLDQIPTSEKLRRGIENRARVATP